MRARVVRAATSLWSSPSSLALGTVLSAVLSLGYAPLLARALGPEGRGVVAAVIAAQFLVPLLLSAGVPLEVRRLSAIQDGSAAVRTARIVAMLTSPFSVFAAWALHATVFSSLGNAEAALAFVAIALAPVGIVVLTESGYLLANGKYGPLLLVKLIQPFSLLLCAAVLFPVGALSINGVLAVAIISNLLTWIVCETTVRISFRGERLAPVRLLGGGTKYAGSSAAEAANNRVDQLIALPIIGDAAAGFYAVGVTLSTLPLAIGQSLASQYFREVAQSATSPRSRAEMVGRAWTLSWAVAIALMAAAPVAIPLIFGADFQPAIWPTWILLLGSPAVVCSYVLSMQLAAVGRGVAMTLGQIGALFTGTTVLVVVGKELRETGAALAAVMASVVLLGYLSAISGIGLRAFVPNWQRFVAGVSDLLRRRVRSTEL